MKEKIKGWLFWFIGLLLWDCMAIAIEVGTGWRGAGYGAVISCLWLLVVSHKYDL